MTAASLLLIVQGIQAAISAAPEVESVVENAKTWVSSLFSSGVITIAQQNAVNAQIDAIVAAFAGGTTPPEFQVQPDPGS